MGSYSSHGQLMTRAPVNAHVTAECDVPDCISRRALHGMDAAVRNLDAGIAGDEFDLVEVQELLDEP